jgi:hypothetical protein
MMLIYLLDTCYSNALAYVQHTGHSPASFLLFVFNILSLDLPRRVTEHA